MTVSKHALVAFDFSPPSTRALELARTLRATLHCSLDVIHVFLDPFAEMKHPPKESVWATPEQRDAHLRAVGEQARKEVEKVFGAESQAIPLHVERGDPADRILAKAEELGTDLLIVGSTGKGGVERALLGSVSQKLVRHGPGAVLTVH